MDFFKRMFNREQHSGNDSLKRIQVIEDGEARKISNADVQSIIARDIKDSTIIQYFEEENHAGPIVDQKINDDVELICKSRFFDEFDTTWSSLALARRLVEGELSGGSDEVKCRAMAWCARSLSPTELDKAEENLKLAKTLGSCSEIEIADAFICSQKGDKNTALRILAGIDSPLSRSAALMIVANREGAQAAVDWLKIAGIDVADLNPDGRHFLLSLHLQLAHWEAAQASLKTLTGDDFRETPALHHMVAITHLISTVPNELRTVVLRQLPFVAEGFPLAADAASIDARREAHRHFIAASEVAQQLNCPSAATIDDEYALWLELKDPDELDKGRERLESKLRDPKSALRLVHLGLQFGIKVDLEAVDREIERQIALHGGITHDAASARFALAFTKKDPEDIANYIARHRDELVKYYDKKSLQFLQIEMLSKAGLSEKAKECMEILVEEGLPEDEESRLRRMIAEVAGTNPVESRKEQYKETESLGDLVILVDQLEIEGEWDGLCEYGEILFERTRSLNDAERLAKALNNAKKSERLVELLNTNPALLAQSKNLQMLFCWSLYHEGALLEARTELSKLSDDRDNANYRALQVHLGIAVGDWNSLTAHVANESLEKDKRSAQELIGAAQLALYLGSPHAKELTFSAVDKGDDDAHVLTAAYLLASSAGWEDDAEVSQWLNKAAELSSDDGPIQKKSLKDILNMKPDWDRRESETLQQLSRGDIPMFLAAQHLNKSLIHMILFPALANLLENDPRRRVAVPAFSGKLQQTPFNTGGAVGMDATVLLTLSFLDLLDEALSAFDTVYVPHSTLTWLFEEKQKAAFHQPSRFRDAHQVHHLLATGVFEKLMPNTVPDSELSAQVGDELALLITEAEKESYTDDTQRIVVRSSPVHRLASLMEEEADLTAHAAVLSSCQSIVDKLRQKGQLTAKEAKKAYNYLQLHEKIWPDQPEIADGAILYMDDLAISYFLHLGILEKLHSVGFRVIASPREVSEANELISYQRISDKINEAIEHIRSAVNLRIESGKIKVGRRRNMDEPEMQSISKHPTLGLFGLARDCKAIFVDDRSFNQHASINDGSVQVPIFSTLDLLDALVSNGSITSEDRLENRTRLRQAGYCFVPVNEYELANHLDASTVTDSKVIETAELKAIRENILCVRMSSRLQLPKEAPWLDGLLQTFIRVLKGLWRSDADFSEIRVRSNWIMSQIDVRGWAHSFGSGAGDSIVKTGRGAHILLLLLPPVDAPPEIKDEYWNWMEDMVLAPLKGQYPDLYSWIIEWQRREVSEMADMDIREGATT